MDGQETDTIRRPQPDRGGEGGRLWGYRYMRVRVDLRTIRIPREELVALTAQAAFWHHTANNVEGKIWKTLEFLGGVVVLFLCTTFCRRINKTLFAKLKKAQEGRVEAG